MYVQKKLQKTCLQYSITFIFPAVIYEDSICSISSVTFGVEIFLILTLMFGVMTEKT